MGEEMIKRIFLDLDGVIRAWDSAVIELYDLNISQKDVSTWGALEERASNLHGISKKDFWEGQNQYFWEGLEFTDEAEGVLALLDKTKLDVVLLTSPTMNNAGWSQSWIRKHLPTYFYSQKYLIGPCKYVCANLESLLIDDAEKNIFPWVQNGGVGFLFPRPWNQMRSRAAMPVKDLEDYLRMLRLI